MNDKLWWLLLPRSWIKPFFATEKRGITSTNSNKAGWDFLLTELLFSTKEKFQSFFLLPYILLYNGPIPTTT